MAKSKELVSPETGEIVELPKFLLPSGDGKEHITHEDVEIPLVKLLQATSPGINENGWRAGNFLHNILEREVPGSEGMRIVVITALRPIYMLFNPVDQGGGVLARAKDGVHWAPPNHEFKVKINKGSKEVLWRTADTVARSGLAEWGSYDPDDPGSVPAADLQYRFICVSPDYPEFGPFMIRMQRSGIAAAKRLNNRLVGSEYPSYALVHHVRSVWEDKGPDDKKFVWKFSGSMGPEAYVQSEEDFLKYKALYESFKDVDVEPVGGDVPDDEVRPGEATSTVPPAHQNPGRKKKTDVPDDADNVGDQGFEF